MAKGKKGRSGGAARGAPPARKQRHVSKAESPTAPADPGPSSPEARPENNGPAHGSDAQADGAAAPAEHSAPTSKMPPLPVVEPTAEPDAVQDVSMDPWDTSVQKANPAQQEGANQQEATDKDQKLAVADTDKAKAAQFAASGPARPSEPEPSDQPDADTSKADEETEAGGKDGMDEESSMSDRTTSSASISEPVFKYEVLHGSVADILAQDSISALAVAPERLAIGMHSGAIFVLRIDGTLERALHLHSAAVHDVVFDASGETVGSAGMDGHVAITSLHTSEQYRFDFRRPMRALALDPQFGRRSTRAFVSGGLAGALVLREKGWFGHRETVLHSGEGPVWSIAWRSHWIAWANDGGVRIADARTHRLLARIPAPEDATRRDVARCTLSWGSDTSLLIAQGDQLTRVEMRVADVPTASDSNARPLAQLVPTLGPAGQAPGAHAEITDIFQLDSIVSGAEVWGPEELLVLAYADDSETTLRPELRTISMQGEELDNDQLYLHSSSRFRYNDFHLRMGVEQRQDPTKPSHVRSEPMFYVASPAQVIVGRPRDDRDHVEWLLAHRHFRAALEHLEYLGPAASAALGFDAKAIGRQYLNSLLDAGEYEALAAALPGTLGGDTSAWEHYVFAMLERQQAKVLLPHLPTGTPQLSEVTYDMVLVQLLHRDAHLLLDTLCQWPVQLYSTQAVAAAIEDACATRRRRDTSAEEDIPLLLEALAQLYLANRQPGKALQYLLRLRRKEVFDLVREQNLFTAVQDRVAELVELEEHVRASAPSGNATASSAKGPAGSAVVALLVDHMHSIPIQRVMPQLEAYPEFQYRYLDAVFACDPQLVTAYTDRMVELYAEYDTAKLMPFLRAMSDVYSFSRAYETCARHDLVPEMVFLLGRAGDNQGALNLIIERLQNVRQAIDFVKQQDDPELWGSLLRYSRDRPNFIRGLLEHVGGEIGPVQIIRSIRNGLEIPGLKPALIKILHNFNLQVSLLDGCSAVLQHAAQELAEQQQHAQSAALYCDRQDTTCCVCQRPVLADEGAVLVFLCWHAAHLACVEPHAVTSRGAATRFPLPAETATQAGAAARLGWIGRTDETGTVHVRGNEGERSGTYPQDRMLRQALLRERPLRASKDPVECPKCRTTHVLYLD